MNVERGLLFAQELLVSRGVQANYASGPFSASVPWNDGYYSKSSYSEISGLASYAFNGGADTVAVAAEGQLGHTGYGNKWLLAVPEQQPRSTTSSSGPTLRATGRSACTSSTPTLTGTMTTPPAARCW